MAKCCWQAGPPAQVLEAHTGPTGQIQGRNSVCSPVIPFCKHSPDVEGAFLRFAPELAHHNCDYDPRHFDLPFALEDASFRFQARSDLILWALRRFFPKAEPITEIGVGSGFVMRAIHQGAAA
jgi:hypothetical protein